MSRAIIDRNRKTLVDMAEEAERHKEPPGDDRWFEGMTLGRKRLVRLIYAAMAIYEFRKHRHREVGKSAEIIIEGIFMEVGRLRKMVIDLDAAGGKHTSDLMRAAAVLGMSAEDVAEMDSANIPDKKTAWKLIAAARVASRQKVALGRKLREREAAAATTKRMNEDERFRIAKADEGAK